MSVKNINTVINSTLPSNPNINQFKGEAYALRALVNFELVRNFATPYTTDQNAYGVPLINTFDQNSFPARNSVKEVYDQINSDLNQVAQNRDPSFAGYASSGTQLINDIIAERRKELAFEGDRMFDLLRTNATINKVRRENPTQLIVVAPGNFMRIFPIPQLELDVNTSIRSQQNPGY